MTIRSIGNDLSSVLLQEGSTITDDTYGLFTATATFLLDTSKNGPDSEDVPQRGDSYPATAWNFLKVDKVQRQIISAETTRLIVSYVGVKPPAGEGIAITTPNVEDTSGTSTEPIETHENFYGSATSTITYTGPIAGVGSGTNDPTIQPVYNESSMHLAPNDPNTYYEGDNGACFVQATGGKFVGFLNPAYPKFYGKKSYISPTSSWTGILYTTNLSTAQTLKKQNCTTSTDGQISDVRVLPTEYGTTFVSDDGDPQLLFMNVGMKKFSNDVYRITYTVRFCAEGFPGQVYPSTRV